ncbi:hypothetical protein H5410_014575 [Solanum commersonii]|uniref:Uncharacterized protein n=1 Tax=Solanum commersonii TaxID=4109 RepID=A0A9J5ZRU9_SOLCO|nr:hypothetical protein H5410_014575 [Solanum commersonii]
MIVIPRAPSFSIGVTQLNSSNTNMRSWSPSRPSPNVGVGRLAMIMNWQDTRTRASTSEGEAIPASKAQFMGEVGDAQTKVRGPTQPSSVLNYTLMLHELIVRLLDRLDSIPLSCVLSGTSCSHFIVGATPPTSDLASALLLAPLRFAVPHISASVVMFVAKFDDTTGDKAYDFLTECQHRLFNLGILEAHGMLILLISSHEWPRNNGGRNKYGTRTKKEPFTGVLTRHPTGVSHQTLIYWGVLIGRPTGVSHQALFTGVLVWASYWRVTSSPYLLGFDWASCWRLEGAMPHPKPRILMSFLVQFMA